MTFCLRAHVWYQYAMRRAIIAAENDGDPNERLLWHGTKFTSLILRDGFDPRVCASPALPACPW